MDKVTAFETQSHRLTDRSVDITTEEDKREGRVSTWRAIFMIFRSLVAIGVLTIPHAVQHFGVIGALIFFPIFAVVALYILDLMLLISNDVGYYGDEVEELIVRSNNQKYLTIFSLMNNGMLVAGGIANCIFSVMFLNWATCSMGVEQLCDNRQMLHLIALLISLPFAFIHKVGFFSITSIVAVIVFFITSNLQLSQ